MQRCMFIPQPIVKLLVVIQDAIRDVKLPNWGWQDPAVSVV